MLPTTLAASTLKIPEQALGVTLQMLYELPSIGGQLSASQRRCLHGL
jgi:hypothetical protein